jgi:hypothetical protein
MSTVSKSDPPGYSRNVDTINADSYDNAKSRQTFAFRLTLNSAGSYTGARENHTNFFPQGTLLFGMAGDPPLRPREE